jgi:penicillin-binding protein 2
VAIDVHSGAILAAATFPSYTQDEYETDYAKLATDETKPLFNRAFFGTYARGSTFKMATGIAALEENAVGLNEYIRDTGIYTKYAPSYSPRCWVYTDYGHGHGLQNVVAALKNSCNYYFYEVADRMGIELLNKYCRKLELGVKTGVEIGESAGILAGPDYRASIDEQWFPGDTLQAAIGQSDNLFTPLQLANYVATIVNGGTRYKTHLVKGIYDATTGLCVQEEQIEIMDNLKMDEDNYHAIMQGMLECATTGTAAGVFGPNYEITAGAKTGTASVPQGTANGVFVAFAPYNDPQIAVCVVVEHGAHGNYVGSVARDIFDAYFADVQSNGSLTQENTLLS